MRCWWIIFINHCILLNLYARVTAFCTTCRLWIQVPFRNSLHLKIDASSIRCTITACRTWKSPAVLWLMQSQPVTPEAQVWSDGFVLGKVTQGQVLRWWPQFSPFIIITPVLQIHILLIYHQCYIILVTVVVNKMLLCHWNLSLGCAIYPIHYIFSHFTAKKENE
jgi:hypothetical protein